MPLIPNKAEPSSTPLTPSPAASSTSTGELAVNVAFGLCAVAGTAITLWQAHRLWRMFRHHTPHSARAHDNDEAVSTVNVELASVGTMSPTGTATTRPSQDVSTASSAQSRQGTAAQG